MSFKRARWIAGGVIGASLVIAFLFLAARVPLTAPTLRERIIETLSEALDANVELGRVTHQLWPLHAEMDDLVIRRRGQGDDRPALISVQHLTVDAGITELLRRRVNRVELTGLAITISPKPEEQPAESGKVASDNVASGSVASGSSRTSEPADEKSEAESEPPDEKSEDQPPSMMSRVGRDVIVSEVIANEAVLTILRRDANKPARVWTLHRLQLRDVGAHSQMSFQSALTNAVPPGEIDTAGRFGPWNRDDNAKTPLEGTFTFANANLGVFKGIKGTLSAKGSYEGSLERIAVDGETDVPNFSLDIGKHPMLLHAAYRAVVDGTNGNTMLEQIDAKLQDTPISARGGVYEAKNVKGRFVRLRVEVPNGQMADLIRLSVNTPKPTMTGTLRMGASLEIPPGDLDVVEKLRLDGAFLLERGRFTNPDVQQKINELSHRARGKNLGESRTMESSDFSGWFGLKDGSLALHDLTFGTPGAVVEIDGTYALRSGALDFSGNLYMDAKVSETMSGWKSFLLKIIDPLFREGKQTVVPLKIHGTREKPEFGLDLKRVF